MELQLEFLAYSFCKLILSPQLLYLPINLYQIHHQRLIKNPLNVVYELHNLSHKPECYPHVYLCLNKRKFLLRCGLTVHLKSQGTPVLLSLIHI